MKKHLIVITILFGLNVLAWKQAELFGQGSTNIDWLKSLYEQGVRESGDSIELSPEVLRLLNDADYRKQIYPSTYTWETVVDNVHKQDLRKAFWHMINLYMVNDQNKDIVVKSVISYDRLFKMDKILTGTFYTYILADPEINSIKNGLANVVAPHKMEAKLKALRDILGYLDQARATSAKKTEGKKSNQP